MDYGQFVVLARFEGVKDLDLEEGGEGGEGGRLVALLDVVSYYVLDSYQVY